MFTAAQEGFAAIQARNDERIPQRVHPAPARHVAY